MHILLTGNSSFILSNFRAGLIRALIADGHRLSALAPEDDHAADLRGLGCRVVPLRIDRTGTNPAAEAALLARVFRALRRERPDAVLSYTIKNNIYGALAANRLGIPFLPNVTGLGTAFTGPGMLNRVVLTLYRRAFRELPVVFFQNDADMATLTGAGIVAPGRARLLPGSGVDLDAFAPAPLPERGTGVTFVLMARMLWDKGVGEYVEAARRIRATRPEIRFQLVGPTDDANPAAIDAATVAGWAAEGAVDYLGTVADVRPVIAGADCLVLPTYYREGTPRSLLEAGAMARPAIATDAPGCRDVVADGETGYLCAPRDVDSLTAALTRMIDDGPARRAAMGRAARARVARLYDEAHVIAAYRAALAEITAS